MMSAFGIDHGEIAKAARPPKVGWLARRRMPKAPGGKTPTAAQVRTKGQGAATHTEREKAGLNRAGETEVSLKGIGRGISRVGRGTSNLMERHPGLTGTAVVGGGGAAGYKLLSEREPRKKRA